MSMVRRLVFGLSFALAVWCTAPDASAQERMALDLSAAVSAVSTVPPVALTTDQLPVTFNSDYRRPGPSHLMRSLYVTTAVMQALDVHSTLSALNNGAIEANPLMTQVSKNKAMFIALKTGVAVSTVMAARNMSKRNKIAAVVTLVAINSAYAMVIRHNYKVAGSGR
jgi:hypothetical protein